MLAVVALGVSPAVADEAWGTALRPSGVQASIADATDEDAYTVRAALGAPLRFRVDVARGSELDPVLTLHGPDGRAVAFEESRKGRRVVVEDARATHGPGLYRLTIAGRDGSTGDYRVRGGSKGSGRAVANGISIGAGEELRLPFGAAGGSRVKFTVRSRDLPVRFVRIEDPYGRPVPVADDDVRTRGGKVRCRGVELPAGHRFARWHVVVSGAARALSGVRSRIDVTGGERAPRPRRLGDDEPELLGLDVDESGVGLPIELLVPGEDDAASYRVFVGGRQAEVLGRSEDVLRVEVPTGPLGRVDVGLVREDGQTAHLADALLLVPAPTISRLEPASGPALGGTTVTVEGSGFRDGLTILLGGRDVTTPIEVLDDTRLRFETPEIGLGGGRLIVRDRTGLAAERPDAFRYIVPAGVARLEPREVPAGLSSTLTIEGNDLALSSAALAGSEGVSSSVVSPQRMTVELPPLPAGDYELSITDVHGQRANGDTTFRVFRYELATEHTALGRPAPAAAVLLDIDQDGDQDLVTVARGGSTLSSESLLTVLRNDGGGSWADVSEDWRPEGTADDWRGGSIATGHLFGESGSATPDAYPDLVIGTTDADVLAAGRSRVRLLANRAAPDGGRRFVDVTDTQMAVPLARDVWQADRVWVGDLEGDGGTPEIVATHDEPAFQTEGTAPTFVHHGSGTRVFSYSGSPKRFRWEPTRTPTVLGVTQPFGAFPVCTENECADEYENFQGTDLAIADLDLDGRKDFVTTRLGERTYRNNVASSTQIGRNVVGTVDSITSALPIDETTYPADRVLLGPLTDDDRPDLVLLTSTPTATGNLLELAGNGGIGRESWSRLTDWRPTVDGETFRAHDGDLLDLDADGDLDLLLVRRAPDIGITRTLLPLRNHDGRLDTALDEVLPDLGSLPADAVLVAGVLHHDTLSLLVLTQETGSDDVRLQVLRRTYE